MRKIGLIDRIANHLLINLADKAIGIENGLIKQGGLEMANLNDFKLVNIKVERCFLILKMLKRRT